jgi:hypothetical protein
MHCILEGLAQNHFRYVLCLTAASAAAPTPRQPAFSHKFTEVDKNHPPPNLKSNDITHVAATHRLLVAPLEGVGDDGTIADPAVHGDNLAKLLKQLTNKSLQSLQFVCQDLNIQPRRGLTATANSPVRFYKRDWAEALVQWVTIFIDLRVYSSDSVTSY